MRWRWYQSRFYMAWMHRCWLCLIYPTHPTTRRVQRMIEEERLASIERGHLKARRDR